MNKGITTTVEDIKKVYSGAVGCMCGCKGKYSTDTKTITKQWNRASRLTTDWQVKERDETSQYLYISYLTEAGSERCICFYRDAN